MNAVVNQVLIVRNASFLSAQRSSYALTPRAATLPVSGTFGGHLSYVSINIETVWQCCSSNLNYSSYDPILKDCEHIVFGLSICFLQKLLKLAIICECK
jgi:hypothetical protein